MTEDKKPKRGGARPGAGRPSTGSTLYTFRAPKELAAIIDIQENKTEFLKACIRNYASVQEPDFSQFGQAYPAEMVREMTLPYFDQRVVAGFPVPLDNDERAKDIDILRMLCPHPESSYLIRVEGDSMIDAGIFSGDIVIVDKSNRNPSEEEVAICELNGEYTLKRFVKRGNEGWLIPANPEYPEFHITEDDEFRIWGVVTFIIHRAR